MPLVIVSPLSRLHETLDTSGARDVLTLVTRREEAPDLTGMGIKRHNVMIFADIISPREGYVLATLDHVRSIIDFASGWDRNADLLIHCFAGISRSTAAAYISACALMPDRDEAELAQELRKASPSATPNIHLVGLADEMLGRDGRMVAAIRAIGRGAEAFEGEVFSLDIREPNRPAA